MKKLTLTALALAVSTIVFAQGNVNRQTTTTVRTVTPQSAYATQAYSTQRSPTAQQYGAVETQYNQAATAVGTANPVASGTVGYTADKTVNKFNGGVSPTDRAQVLALDPRGQTKLALSVHPDDFESVVGAIKTTVLSGNYDAYDMAEQRSNTQPWVPLTPATGNVTYTEESSSNVGPGHIIGGRGTYPTSNAAGGATARFNQ